MPHSLFGRKAPSQCRNGRDSWRRCRPAGARVLL